MTERAERIPRKPLRLNPVNLGPGLALSLCSDDNLCERTVGRRHALDELVVDDVDRAREQLRRLGVRTRDEEHRRLHQVELEARCDETRDVRGRRDEHFTREVAALLTTDELVFQVDRGRALSYRGEVQ